MNHAEMINLHKILYPEEYESGYIFTYITFNAELKVLIEKSGYKKTFKIKYFKGLQFLSNLKRTCTMLPKLFEELLGSDGIYSMTLHGQKNIRILFIFEEINQQEVVVLLNCFQERRTKDYVKEISEAKSRWKELTDT